MITNTLTVPRFESVEENVEWMETFSGWFGAIRASADCRREYIAWQDNQPVREWMEGLHE